jgi:hypothetical protein
MQSIWVTEQQQKILITYRLQDKKSIADPHNSSPDGKWHYALMRRQRQNAKRHMDD